MLVNPFRIFFRTRTDFLKNVLIFLLAIIIFRLFQIQILQHEKYVKKAEEQHVRQDVILAKRGEIYMLDGDEPTPVVMNSKVWTIILDPQIARLEQGKVQEEIDKEIPQNKVIADWNEVFASKISRYAVVARNVPYAKAQKIKGKKLSGVYFQETAKRMYPEGDMASGLLGFVNADGVGQYGIEGALNKRLSGENGLLKTIKDVNNTPLTIGDNNVRVPAKNGDNVVLSIDKNIQYAAEKALKEVTDAYKVRYASAIVMDPKNGQIQAMAALPNYDASNYGAVADASIFQTNATMYTYEPASVCKTFAFATAIDQGVMTPETTFYNTDSLTIDGMPINNLSKGHLGNITMQTALSWSLNTGSTTALMLLGGDPARINLQGKNKLYDYYYNKFMLGKYTGVELIESPGMIIPPDSIDGTDARYANMTFGQGLSLTLMQIATAFSTVVNGGEYYVPTVVSGVMRDGEYVKDDTVRKSTHRAISEETSRTMREMLVKARKLYANVGAYDGNYFVGGKTGTAQAVRDGKYVFDETIATYTGFGAVDATSEPEYVIVTKIWDDGAYLDGGTHAKPIFDKISQFMINYLQMRSK